MKYLMALIAATNIIIVIYQALTWKHHRARCISYQHMLDLLKDERTKL